MTARRFTRAALAATAATAVGFGVLALGQQSAVGAVADDDLIGRPAQERNVDVGRSGPSVGDRYVFSENLFDDDDNDRVGRLAGSCDITLVKRKANGDPKDAMMQCFATFRLSDGQITVQGVNWWSDETLVLPVTGGSGAYDDASGEVTIEFVNEKKTVYDFSLNGDGGVIP